MKGAFPAGVAVVVGGSGGLGKAICRRLASAGADVALTWRTSQTEASAAASGVRAEGKQAWTFQLDLNDGPEQTARCFESIRALGPIHTVVQAAGFHIPMRYISEVTPPLWRDVIESDVNGFFNLVHAALPWLREEGGGSLVVVSTAGLERWPDKDVLSVAPKAAIAALMRGIAREEGRYNVRANSVAPGVIEGGMFLELQARGELDARWIDSARRRTALKRFGTPEEIAEAVAFLASSRASYITGQTLTLDGGFSL